ncbi:helicase RepA family protein [Paraburkholderia sediminicola]|uniref:helicase RepA family protein n=1 Tax=Paraburkholderia sediminicola TaxID=458836 RepID=UPI0038BA711A
MQLSELRLDIRKALSEPPPLLDHVLPGLLAGTVGALIGPGGVGKTMLLTQLACDIAAGAPVGGGLLTQERLAPEGAPVVLLLAEESQIIMRHRLQAAIQSIRRMDRFRDASACDALIARLSDNLRLYPLAGGGRIICVSHGELSKGGVATIASVCEGARMVIVDPLRRFHAGEENDSSHMTAVVGAFEKIARETGAAVLLSHHANRSSVLTGNGELPSASRGSSALTDGVRWQANLSVVTEQTASRYRIAESERQLVVRLDFAKANYIAAPAPSILQKDPASGALSLWRRTSTAARVRSKRAAAAQRDTPMTEGGV